MKKFLRLLFCFVVSFGAITPAMAQQEQNTNALIDSLKKALSGQIHDTDKVLMLCSISYRYNTVSPSDGIKYGMQALSLAEDLSWQTGIAKSCSCLGANYFSLSDYKNAYKYWLNSLQINEKINNTIGVARHLHNIGDIFFIQEDYDNALEYYNKALAVSQKDSNKQFATNSFTAIGKVYERQKKYEDALQYHFKALEIDEDGQNLGNIASDYLYIASAYSGTDSFQKALYYFFKALQIKDKMGDKKGIANCYQGIGEVYFKQQKYPDAEQYTNKSLALYKEISNLEGMQEVYKNLSDIYDKQGITGKAFECYKAYITAKDSVFSKENVKKLLQTQIQYEYDKKEEQSKMAQEKKDLRTRVIIYSGIAGIIVLLAFLLLVYRSFRVQKRLNKIISQLISEREKTIEIRTAELRASNQKLIDMIHYNAHNIREPLTRISGLMNLREYVDENEYMTTYWSLIGKAVNDLDTRVKQVILDLEETTGA